MKQNMGIIDKAIRIGAAILVAGLYFTGTISGTIAIVMGVIGLVMLGTSLVGVCPLYLPFKLSTKKEQ